MPIKPRNAPDYYCANCDLQFWQSLWRRLLGLKPPPFAPCPKCGRIAGPLTY
ncbi:MAG: hypothetical protein HN904_03865 [Victivallales bacterium]|jgi:hypothetical protein|nr:hypothetical protein [Victivallales bacterium]